MSCLKKWNRGIILLLLLIIGVALYVVVTTFSNRQDSSGIAEYMNEYLSTESALYVLPQVYEKTNASASDSVYYAMQKKAKETLSPYYLEGSNGYKASAALIASVAKRQLEDGYHINSFYCIDASVSSMNYVGNTVTCILKYKVRYEGSTAFLKNVVSDNENYSYRDVYEQQIRLSKTEDGWKLIDFGGAAMFYPYLDRTALILQ